LILNSNKDNNIMATNPDKALNKTSQEWKAVAAQYEQQNEELAKTQAELTAEAQSLFKQKADIANQLRALRYNRPPFNEGLTSTEFKLRETALLQQDRQINIQREQVLSEKAQITNQISENNAAIAKANTRADIAQEGEANTETTTPPASQAPGDGATVPPVPPLIQTVNSTTLLDTNNETTVTTTLPPLTPAMLDNPTPITSAETSPVAPVVITSTSLIVPTDQYDPTGLNAGDQIPGVPIVKTTIVNDDQGNPLVLTQPVDVIEPQKTADAYPNEFQGVDEAIALQKTIDTNTSGLPVLAEDGVGVASGVLINPETGQTYYPEPTGSSKGLQGARTNTQAQSTAQDQAAFALKQDWRVRLSLAPNSSYLYNAINVQGILQPLIETNGVIFPYTPNVQVQYSAHYDSYDLVHSNYKIHQYKNSSVDSINISCDFTAQDTAEANYLLAVIHFFKSVTKMFYGQDSLPKIGTPPPLCFLTGLGAFQFDNHPLVITNFAYNLPTDVDYIRATSSATTAGGVSKAPAQPPNNTDVISNNRLTSGPNSVARGAVTPNPNFDNQTTIQTPSASTRTPTYVPTKMNLAISAYPIVTRNDISNRFSLRDYATGRLLQGSKNSTVGIW
jgi:hypothetical protein